MTALSFLQSQSRNAPREIARASIGACLGILLTGLVSSWWFGSPVAAPLLIAPMGASAVLLFGLPASPLAQPHAIIGGNLLAALIGVSIAKLVPFPLPAAALAVAAAIAAMVACRCAHPPSGAVALTAVLGGPHILAAGFGFVFVPVLLESVLLTLAALVYNNATQRSYPHRAHPAPHPGEIAMPVRLAANDFEAVIADYGEPLDIGAEDLEALFDMLVDRAQKIGRR
ncbi:HPP family protein [Sphingomonas sp. MMS24-J13]|uniref:HPP family protein n=1 Tax=Sphingomonas sp. MMS24-J13 TaxID=3238686 RepID=UPI00384F321A